MALSNLIQRTLSALALIPLAIGVTVLGGWSFSAFVVVAACIMLFEWKNMILNKTPEVSLKSKNAVISWWIGGIFYIALPVAAILYIRLLPLPMCAPFFDMVAPCDTTLKDPSAHALIWLMAVVWATDIGAYAAGRAIGGPKLAPRISPKKTWAGLIGGMVCAAAISELLLRQSGFWRVLVTMPVQPFIVGMAFAIISQAGDLFESWVKRRFGVKDSGNIIPGHGGILDRVDGLMFAAPVFALLVYSVYGYEF